MQIAIGADYMGFNMKETFKTWLLEQRHEVKDVGTCSVEPVDYPDYAFMVAAKVATRRTERGVLICRTGVGMAIAANKVARIRAAFWPDLFTARMSREHNNAKILTLGGYLTGQELTRELLAVWLKTQFAGGNHFQPMDKINTIGLGRLTRDRLNGVCSKSDWGLNLG